MKYEIERKYLVKVLPAKLPKPTKIWQGYLHDSSPVVRVRIYNDTMAEMTIKGKGKLKKVEYNLPIPLWVAKDLKKLCVSHLSKLRYRIGRWDLDYFPQRDLWLAEIELKRKNEAIKLPYWAGVEVTFFKDYSNTQLATGKRIVKRCVSCSSEFGPGTGKSFCCDVQSTITRAKRPAA